MNAHFSFDQEGPLPPIPTYGYARVEDVEFSRNREVARVSLDMVGADWMDERLKLAQAAASTVLGKDDFEQMPLYHLEMTLDARILTWSRHKLFWKQNRYWNRKCWEYSAALAGVLWPALGTGSHAADSGWFNVQLSAERPGHKARLFCNLSEQQRPVYAHLSPCTHSAALSQACALDAPVSMLRSDVVDKLKRIDSERIVVFDVGQGNANGLTQGNQPPSLYFDSGAGVYRNHRTRPATLSLPADNAEVVILSHWDSDHWAGATLPHNQDLLKKIWIAPIQEVGPRHKAFAQSIKDAKGELILLEMGSHIETIPLSGGRVLKLVQGCGSERNDSGLVLCIEDTASDSSMILPGDCDYHCFSHLTPLPAKGMVVPHHGARLASTSTDVPARHSNGAVLAYSFGPDNAHGKARVRHPTQESVTLHDAWNHRGWSVRRPGIGLPTGEVRATCEHSPGTSRGDIYLDW